MVEGRRQSIRWATYSRKTCNTGKRSIAPTTFCHAFKDLTCPTIKRSFYLVTALTNCSTYITQKAGPMNGSESSMLLVTLERKAMLCPYPLLGKTGKGKKELKNM